MNDLAQALATYSPLGKRYWRTKMLWSIGFLAFALAFFITPLVQEYITFAQDALRDDWGAFLGTFFDGSGPPALYPVVSLGWTLVFVRPDWRRHANARAFRVAILQRTNLSTPFPPDQQAALYAGEQAALPTAFGPFQDVLYRQRRGLYGLAIGLPLAGVCLGGFIPVVLWLAHVALPKDVLHAAPLSVTLEIGVFEAFALALVCAPLWLLLWAWRLSRPLWLEADEIGLRPRGVASDSPQAIRWADVKAFSLIRKQPPRSLTARELDRYKGEILPYPQLFLDTGATLLTWTPSPAPSDETLAAYQSLLRTIITRVGQEPQDLTAAADMTNLLAMTPKPERIVLKNWPTLRALIASMASGNRRNLRFFLWSIITPLALVFLPYVIACIAAIIQATIQ